MKAAAVVVVAVVVGAVVGAVEVVDVCFVFLEFFFPVEDFVVAASVEELKELEVVVVVEVAVAAGDEAVAGAGAGAGAVVGAVVEVVDVVEATEVVLVHQTSKVHDDGKWGLAGSAVDFVFDFAVPGSDGMQQRFPLPLLLCIPLNIHRHQ